MRPSAGLDSSDFARMRDEVQEWLDGIGVEQTAPIETIYEAPWSTVLRVPTVEGDLYLKQCEPVQAFEVALTVALASRWPDRVPEVVGADVSRAWLLLRDGGTPLSESGAFELLPRALELYGEIQRGEAAHVDELLAIGLRDLRLPALADAYEPFFEDDRGLESAELARLCALAPRYRELCEELDAFGLPASIQHDDLHEYNVFVREERIAIFDWGDSSVAHPLLSWLKVLRVTIERGLDGEPLRSAYLSAWTSLLPEERLREALDVAVSVASFAYPLQQQRQADALPADAQAHYDEYIPANLRRLLARLA